MKRFMLKIFWVAAAAILGAGQVGAQTNLVKNGDFSTMSDWGATEVTLTTGNITNVFAGINTQLKMYVLSMSVNVHPLALLPVIPAPLSQTINVQANHTYRLSFLSEGAQEYDRINGYYELTPSPAWQVTFDGQTKFAKPNHFVNNDVDWTSNSMDFTVGNVTSAILSFTTSLGSVFSYLTPGCVPCQVAGQNNVLSNVSMIDVTPVVAPTLAVTKALGGNRVANSDQFTVQIVQNGSTVVDASTHSTTSGTGSSVGSGSGTTGVTTLVAGTSYLITEAASGTTNLGQYNSTLTCTDAADANKPLPLNTAFSLQTNDAINCTLTNTARPAPVAATLQIRQSVLSPVPPSLLPPYTFQYTGNNGWSAPPVTNTALNQTQFSAAVPLAATNVATTVSTTLPDSRWFVAAFICTDLNAPGSGNPTGTLVRTTSPSVTVPATYVRSGAALRCSMTLGHVTP